MQEDQEHTFERTCAAPIADVWRAWTEPDLLRQWWGPEKTTIEECEVARSVQGDHAVVNLRIDVTEVGSGVKARLAAYGMKWGYDAQLDKLDASLSSLRREA